MKVLIDKSFEKDVNKISYKKVLIAVVDFIESARVSEKIRDLKNCKKLKGSKNAYRIRMGEYRLGFVYENETLIFTRFLHRSKIYDNFP